MKWICILLSFAISCAILYTQYLPRLPDLEPNKIAIASIPYIGFYCLQAFAFTLATPKIKKIDGFVLSNVGYLVNTAIPFQAGEALKVILLRVFNIPVIEGISIVFSLRVFDLFIVVLGVIISILIFTLNTHVTFFWLFFYAFIGFFFRKFFLKFFLFCCRIVRRFVSKTLPLHPEIENRFRYVISDLQNVEWTKVVGLKVVAWGSNFFGFWLIFNSELGPFGINLLVFCAITLGLTVLFTPFGIGQVQLTLSGVMPLLGHEYVPERIMLDIVSWQIAFVLALSFVSCVSLVAGLWAKTLGRHMC